MAINVATDKGQALLKAIYKEIDEKKIRTWRHETFNNIKYLTHCAEQWDGKAWLKASVQSPGLVFNIVKSEHTNISPEIYAIYHGRFIEMLLAHLDSYLTIASATSLATQSDIVSAK